MSGHSKWAQIKRKKAVTDAKKSKVFSKFARLIALESKRTGGNQNDPRLRAVIERARAVNMPSENIERAIKKGADKDAAALEEVTYEAYGPGGVAVLIEGLTDNKNRTVNEIKQILADSGGTLAERGSAAWAFEKKGDGTWIPKTTIPLGDKDAETLATLTERLEENDDVQAVYTNMKYEV